MAESLLESLTRLLRYQRAPTDVTRVFRGWKHNADILPKLQSQIEMLLASYGKFMPIVYDTQGILDDGSDLVLRYRPEGSDKEYELICFQVKSFDDLSKKAYLQELKAQRDDSFRKVVGLHYYFILLCTDSQVHRERVRSIVAEFRSANKTEVIEPAFAFTFLHHPQTRIDALVKRTMESGDLVFRIPSVIRRFVKGGEFPATDEFGSPVGTVRVNDEGTSYGYSPFLVRRGADSGDILLVSFKISDGTSILRLIDDEELEEISPLV